MPLKFWDEAFITTTYLINHMHSKTIDFDTPLERLFYTKPDYASPPFVVRVGQICTPITLTSLLFDPKNVPSQDTVIFTKASNALTYL
jgi:hypothetical protein